MNLEDRVKKRLKMVVDPETGIDVVEMDLINSLTTTDRGDVKLEFRPSSFLCPLAFDLAHEIWQSLRQIDGVKSVHVEVVDCLWADQINRLLQEEGGQA